MRVDRGEIELRVIGFELSPVPQLLIDAHGVLCAANRRARELTGLEGHHLGRAVDDSRLPGRFVELGARINSLIADGSPEILPRVEVAGVSGRRVFDIVTARLPLPEHESVATSVSFIEVAHDGEETAYSMRTLAEVDAAYEEVESTVGELESTNKELQSTLGAIESTNAALDTMNRQLESTSVELESVYEELRQRTDRLNELNSLLGTILTRLQSGVIVVDRDMRVQMWNQHAVELWGLRDDEVECEHLMSLDMGLPVEQLNQPIRSCLSREEGAEFELDLDATDRRGRGIRVRTVVTSLRSSDGQIIGAILILDAG